MNAHKTHAIIAPDGKLELSNLPFQAGSSVEVIVLERETPTAPNFPLRGTFGVMHEPFEPAVNPNEWEALQ